MQIITKCPVCHVTYYLEEEWADKRYRCPNCHNLIKIPRLDQLEDAMKIIKESAGQVCVDEEGNVFG
jgi:transposase-like protein